jgi:hypothetical protein
VLLFRILEPLEIIAAFFFDLFGFYEEGARGEGRGTRGEGRGMRGRGRTVSVEGCAARF